MRIRVVRFQYSDECTIGMLTINNEFFCYTLEDRVRENGAKVYGQTAIPEGKYKLLVNESPRFGRDLPLLLNVPGFGGIRIHRGNFPSDTHGCILVGNDYMSSKLIDSKTAEVALVKKLKVNSRTTTWDGKNERGEAASPGVYLLYAVSTTNESTQVIKFAIVNK